jgi:hypothetical protein
MTMVHVRLDSTLKDRASDALERMGLPWPMVQCQSALHPPLLKKAREAH